MKKFILILAVILLLTCLAPMALAAGSASWTGPSVIRAGDTITLSFSAGGGIYGGSGSVSFDSSQLTLQKYTAVVGGSWAVEFNGNNFVFYDNSMASPINGSTVIFKATFVVNSGLEPGTSVSVSAKGVTLSDGQQDLSVGTQTWTRTVAPPLSGNCDLGSLTVSNATISPAFSPDVTKYTASVPYSVSSLSLSATAADANAKVAVNNPTLAAAATTSVTVTVTAENGTTKKYVIQVYRAQDPNYVPSANADLGSLAVEGFRLSPTFSADVTQYYVWLPYETDTVSVSGTPADNRAKVSVGTYETLTPGEGTDISVTVTAEDGTVQVYTVTVVRAPAHEDIDSFLNGGQVPEPTEPEPTEPETTTPETTEPETTEPDTQPQGDAPSEPPVTAFILIGVLCLAVGIGIGIAVRSAVGLKKKS